MSAERKSGNRSAATGPVAVVVYCLLAALLLFSPVGRAYAAPAEGATVKSSGTSGTVTWEVYTDGTMVLRPTEGDEGTMESLSGYSFGVPWRYENSTIKRVETQGTIHLGNNAAYMFSNLSNCTEMDLSGLDTGNVTIMNSMFRGCTSLTSLDLSGFDTGNVTDMSYMFHNCSGLTSPNVNGLDTGNVTDMSYMFMNCSSLTSLDVSGLDTGNVTNMQQMFYGCSRLTSLDLSGFDTGNVTNMNSMFSRCFNLTSLDVSGFDTKNVTIMAYMFYECRSLTSLDVSGFDTGNVTDMSFMFYNCRSLTSLDVSGLDTDSVTNMNNMFSRCSGLTSLDVSGLDTGNVTIMQQMFYNCSKLTSLDVSGFDTGNVTIMAYMFQECTSLTSLDVSGFDTGNVTDMSYMFQHCYNLTPLDVSGFDTGNVTDMSYMFDACRGLTSIDVSRFKTGNVTDMEQMFGSCTGLTSLDVSGFNTGNVTDMSHMFRGCVGLTSLDVSSFDTGKVTSMNSMFQYCTGLSSLDASSFNTGRATNINSMFSGCTSLVSLDISGFDTGSATNMSSMFDQCKALSGITLGGNFSFRNGGTSCELPVPSSEVSTGKWIREDGAVGPKTPAELKDDYGNNAAVWAGRWVWDTDSSTAIVVFDAQGGYTPQARISVSPVAPVTVPEASRPAYILTAWTKSPDGTGASYQPGASFTPEAGKTTTLYAQWERAAQYTVKHYQQNAQQNGYDLVETETFYGPKNGQATPAVKTYENFISPEAQTVTVAEDGSTVVEYRYDRVVYTIRFDGNGAGSGSVEDQRIPAGTTQRLNDNKFKKDNAVFTGWNTAADGSGTRYGDAQTVQNLAGDNETIVLYAQWLDLGEDSGRESSSGRYTVRIRPGETVSIPDLPAGTKYRVREVDNPDGWSQSGESGTEGTISSNRTDSASITNTYNASGKVSVLAYKAMEGGEAAEGEYEFQLLRGTEVIRTARNGSPDLAEEILSEDGETMVPNPYFGLSVVRFDEIDISQAGDHVYTIKEVRGEADDIEYDSHEETVTIHALDNGNGTLTCTVEYDPDGPVFTNRKIPSFDEPDKTGRLLISKEVPNMPSAGQSFPFTLHLYDKAGTELVDPYKIEIVRTGNEDSYMSGETITESAVSHTENLDDFGNMISGYGEGWGNSNIRGTGREGASPDAHVICIPGAEELTVTVTFGSLGQYRGFAAVWQGAHPEYTMINDFETAAACFLGGGDHTAVSNTRTFTIPGDAVTFCYFSDSSYGSGDRYGYYAVVTAKIPREEFNDKCLSHEEIVSGGTFSLSAGQTAVIRNLPAGVTYRVEEGTVAGFELTSAEGDEGAVTADGETVPDARASFTNVYSGRGEAQIRMTKAFTGGELTDGQFSFRLLDGDGNEVETVSNDAEGNIVFSPIQFGAEDIGQRYAYSVVEVPGDDRAVLYDDHTENVVIAVSDGGDGNLTADVQYKGEGKFTNRPGLSSLKIKKTVRGNLGSRAKDFTFSVTLTDERDAPLTGTFEYAGSATGSITLDATGTGTLQLGHGDEVEIRDIPIGTKYRVTEFDYTEEGYTAASENTSGEIAQDAQTASFVNTREADVPTMVDASVRTGAAALLVSAALLAFFTVKKKTARK